MIGHLAFPLLKVFYTPGLPISRLLRFRGKFRVRTKDGISFFLFNNPFHLETYIFWLGFERFEWEKTTRNVWAELCRSAENIFDIGANTGIFSVMARAYNPNAKVHAFEPQPNIFSVLDKNNKINRFNIRCENLALSDKAGTLPFYNSGSAAFTSENTTAGSLNKSWRPENQQSITVTVDRLDHYIKEKKIAKIDLMKIDVETLEYEVLKGYGDLLMQHQPIIVLEIQHPEIGKNIATLCPASSYAYFNIDENKGLAKVTSLGQSESNHNYILCPISKSGLLAKHLIQPA